MVVIVVVYIIVIAVASPSPLFLLLSLVKSSSFPSSPLVEVIIVIPAIVLSSSLAF